jgi:hypothetical protein
VTRIGQLEITLAVTSNRSTHLRHTIYTGDGEATFLRNVGPYKNHKT